MQRDHHCTIMFPSRNSKSSDVGIKAATSASLISVYHALQIETEKARASLPPTHFINLPLGFDSDFVETITEFREFVLLKYSDLRGMDKSIITQPSTMHLTLLTLKCFSDEDEERAQRVLEASVPQIASILGDDPLTLNLKGLELMNDDPSECHVLYVDIQDDENKRKVLQLASLFLLPVLSNLQDNTSIIVLFSLYIFHDLIFCSYRLPRTRTFSSRALR